MTICPSPSLPPHRLPLSLWLWPCLTREMSVCLSAAAGGGSSSAASGGCDLCGSEAATEEGGGTTTMIIGLVACGHRLCEGCLTGYLASEIEERDGHPIR